MRSLVVAGTAAALLGAASVGQAQALDRDRLEQWLADYGSAWETKDAEAAAALFTADARYYETPYAEPFVGPEGIGEYWAEVTANQRDIEFRSEVLAVDGDVGVARWNAVFAAGPEDARIELDGVFVLEFDGSGLCRELREWWHMREPPAE